VARDGDEAMRRAQAERPDLILLDLMLPKMDGFEVCTLLKRSPATRHIPIIVLSAKTQEDDERRALACGADVYFKKPFQAPVLLEGIRKCLPRTASSTDAA